MTGLRFAEKRQMIYLTSRNGRCVIVNRDVVKLQVDLHCEKKPPCFPFPVKPKQKRDVWVCSVEPTHQRGLGCWYQPKCSAQAPFISRISLSWVNAYISSRPLT